MSVVTLEGQFDSVFWVVDVEKHQNLLLHRYTDLKISQMLLYAPRVYILKSHIKNLKVKSKIKYVIK